MDIVVIIAYFNFSNSEERKIALQKTLTYLDDQVDIILVCHSLDIKSILPLNNVKIIDIPLVSVVWQKERFYDLALSQLKRNHRYVAWIDADLLFTDQDWQGKLREELEDHQLVQLFNRVEDVKLEGKSFSSTGLPRKSVVESLNRNITADDYFNKRGVSLQIGCNPGFGWGAKTETIKKVGFPDFMIMGSGDKVFLAAAMGYHSSFSKTLSLNESLSKLCYHWGNQAFEVFKGKISYLENTIYHIVQGDYENRNYSNRYQSINDDQFVIHDYLEINECGAWQWRNENNEYALKIKNYFHERKD